MAEVEALNGGVTCNERAGFSERIQNSMIQFSDARVCSIESTLSSALVAGTGRFQVVEHNSWCQLRFEKASPADRKHF